MLCAALAVAVVVVVQELPLLILRIILGESQPESGVLELQVVTSRDECSLSVDGSCCGDGLAGCGSGFGTGFIVTFDVETCSISRFLGFGIVLIVTFEIKIGSGSSRSMLTVVGLSISSSSAS